MTYQVKDYWEQRFKARFSLAGTGHSGFSENYNRYMYKLKKRALDDAILHFGIEVQERKILDIGSGTGFFVDYYLQKKAHAVVGIDITDISINFLTKRFPSHRFYKVDLGQECLPVDERFDIINAFDILYHIISDDEFDKAIENINKSCKQGTWIFITDSLMPAIGTAIHIKYRRLGDYKSALGLRGIDVNAVVPVFHFMSKTPIFRTKNNLIKRFCAKVIDSSAPFLYLLDTFYCPMESSNMKLLICKKR